MTANDDCHRETRNSCIDTRLQPGTYTVEARTFRPGTVGAFSLRLSAAPFTPRPFTDDPIVAGETVVKATHVIELRQRIDALLARSERPGFPWTDANPRTRRGPEGGAPPGATGSRQSRVQSGEKVAAQLLRRGRADGCHRRQGHALQRAAGGRFNSWSDGTPARITRSSRRAPRRSPRRRTAAGRRYPPRPRRSEWERRARPRWPPRRPPSRCRRAWPTRCR